MSNPITKRDWTWLEHVPSLFLSIVGAVILGIDVLFHNEVSETALYTAFPGYIRVIFVVFAAAGALACAYGVFSKDTRWEGAGTILVGAAFLLDAIAILSAGTGLFTGSLLAAAGLYLWFQAFVLFPARDYPVPPEAPAVMSLQDYEHQTGITKDEDA